MNAPERIVFLPDIQSREDSRGLQIDAVGIKGVRYPIRIEAEIRGEMAIEELIAVAEVSASCEVYGLLKRAGEKYVTDRAYDNPKFLEDLVRDVALLLNQEARVGAYLVEAENFESIHNHSAFARIARPKPAGEPKGPGSGLGRHAFSIVSAPFQDELIVATRMRDSAYKCALSALPNGTLVKLEGPFGSLALHNNRARPAVFIAAGIGITPFMSILRQAAKDRLPQQMILLYSNRHPENAAFLSELQQLARNSSNFQLIATMTQMEKSRAAWDGKTCPIDELLVRRICSQLSAPIYYLVGPPGMVESMRETLSAAGVNDDDIRSEEFYGY